MVQVEKTIVIHDDTYHYTSGYYTANKWVDDDTIVLCRSKDESIGLTKSRFSAHPKSPTTKKPSAFTQCKRIWEASSLRLIHKQA